MGEGGGAGGAPHGRPRGRTPARRHPPGAPAAVRPRRREAVPPAAAPARRRGGGVASEAGGRARRASRRRGRAGPAASAWGGRVFEVGRKAGSARGRVCGAERTDSAAGPHRRRRSHLYESLPPPVAWRPLAAGGPARATGRGSTAISCAVAAEGTAKPRRSEDRDAGASFLPPRGLESSRGDIILCRQNGGLRPAHLPAGS